MSMLNDVLTLVREICNEKAKIAETLRKQALDFDVKNNYSIVEVTCEEILEEFERRLELLT